VNITRLTFVVGSIVFWKNTAKKLVIQCLSRLHKVNVKRHQQRDEARLWMVRWSYTGQAAKAWSLGLLDIGTYRNKIAKNF